MGCMRICNITAILLLLTNFADCEGVVVHKGQDFHSDDSATSLRFDEVNPQGFVTWFSSRGKTVRYEATQWFRYMEFPPPLIEAVDPKILGARLKQLKSLEDFSVRFKTAAPLMEQTIARVRSDTEKLRDGLVLHQNVWISRVEYEAGLQQKAEKIKLQEQQEEQKKQQEIAKLALESELETKRAEERRAVKIQDLRDKIGELTTEKMALQLQNKNLQDEILSILNRGKVDSEK